MPRIIDGAYEAALIENGNFDAHWLDAVVSDRPVTGEVPLRALAVPVHRASREAPRGQGWNIAEAISIEESLTFNTTNVAYQLFRENERGKLEIGMLADFIVLDPNPLESEPHEIASIAIKAVYRKGIRVG